MKAMSISLFRVSAYGSRIFSAESLQPGSHWAGKIEFGNRDNTLTFALPPDTIEYILESVLDAISTTKEELKAAIDADMVVEFDPRKEASDDIPF